MASVYWISTSSTDWATAANWSGAAVPVSTDDVYLSNNAINIDTNLNQSAVTLNSLTIDQSYTGKIGTASTYLQINATTLNVGRQPGDQTATGSSRLHLKGTYTTCNILDTCSSTADAGYPPVCLAGTITTLNVRSGKVGIAVLTPTETATATTVNVTQSDTASTSPTVVLSPGCSQTTVNLEAGKLVNQSNNTVTTVKVVGGEYRAEGNGAATTLTIEAGKGVINGTGTITTLNVYNATADFSNDPRSKTVTNCHVYRGANLNLNTGVTGSVTLTNGVIVHGCDLGDVTLRVGNDRTLTLS